MALYSVDIEEKGTIQIKSSDGAELNESAILFWLKGLGIAGDFGDDVAIFTDTILKIENILKVQEILSFILMAWGMNYLEYLLKRTKFEWSCADV